MGTNWKKCSITLFFLSLSYCAFTKSISCSDPLIVLFQQIIFASSTKLVRSPCSIYSLIQSKLTPFYQLYLYSIKNTFGQYLSPVLVFLSVTYQILPQVYLLCAMRLLRQSLKLSVHFWMQKQTSFLYTEIKWNSCSCWAITYSK